MDFQLNFPIPIADLEIQHGDRIALMGSCFSDSMHTHFLKSGFEVSSNPFGTLFHPGAIANVLESTIEEAPTIESVQRKDIFFSWDSASKVFGHSEEDLHSVVLDARREFHEFLKSSRVLVITFGTAWGYELKSTKRIVANCHKLPSDLFDKKLMDVEAETLRWSALIDKIRTFNPELKIIFTVSPVRHKNDGLVENNRSKSRLIELVHALNETKNAGYFPSYEIVIDELRDYRFFKECRVHPTHEAVEYVWNRFEETYFSSETRDLAQRVRKLHRTFSHRVLHPDSAESKRHLEVSKKKLVLFQMEYPEVYWE